MAYREWVKHPTLVAADVIITLAMIVAIATAVVWFVS